MGMVILGIGLLGLVTFASGGSGVTGEPLTP